MAYYKDLRQYLKVLEDRGKLIRFKRLVNKDTELQPIVRLQWRGLETEERKAFLFENITDSKGKRYNTPVVLGALAANRELYALGMGCDVDKIPDKWAQVQAKPIPPVVVKSGPAQEEVHTGAGLLEHGGLEEFPIPISTPGYDASPYLTAPYWISKDPETGASNVGTYRAQIKSPTRTGLFMSSRNKHLARHMAKLKQAGVKRIEAAIVLGGPPSLGYVGVAAVPFGLDELSVCGAIAGEPMEVVKCKTVNLEVPAWAEIVIEGTAPVDELEPEGPFGEALGYVGHREDAPYFDVQCITHRKNPILLGFFSQFPPSESSVIRGTGREGALYRHLKHATSLPWVLEIACHESTGSTGLIVIRIGKTEQANVLKTLDEAAKWISMNSASTKMIVAVDEDINARDADMVNWALSFRMQPHRDSRIIQEPAKAVMDPSVMPPEKASEGVVWKESAPTFSRLLINATRQWAYPAVSLPRPEFMERALKIWQEEKMPALKLRSPWQGYDLGFWPKEVDEDARLAVQGDYKLVGEKLAKRRKKV